MGLKRFSSVNLARAGLTLVGAAGGAKMADKLVGGWGLPSVLAQVGGTIMGAVGAHVVFNSFVNPLVGNESTPSSTQETKRSTWTE